jgi:hypothetical protein
MKKSSVKVLAVYPAKTFISFVPCVISGCTNSFSFFCFLTGFGAATSTFLAGFAFLGFFVAGSTVGSFSIVPSSTSFCILSRISARFSVVCLHSSL